MKKIFLSLLLCFSTIFSLTSCKEKEQGCIIKGQMQIQPHPTTQEELIDKSQYILIIKNAYSKNEKMTFNSFPYYLTKYYFEIVEHIKGEFQENSAWFFGDTTKNSCTKTNFDEKLEKDKFYKIYLYTQNYDEYGYNYGDFYTTTIHWMGVELLEDY